MLFVPFRIEVTPQHQTVWLQSSMLRQLLEGLVYVCRAAKLDT